MKKTIRDVIEGAIALIEQGWTQGEAHAIIDGQDFYCLAGALDKAAYGNFEGSRCAFVLVEAMVRRETCFNRVVCFNDGKNTSKEDVLLILKGALDRTVQPLPFEGDSK